MDNRLVLTVVFVTLSWMFVGSYAQNNNTTTMAPDTSNTTMVQLTTLNTTHTTMASNMTTASDNMTHTTMAPNMTTASDNMTHTTMAPNMTAASDNMIHTTMAPNMTHMTMPSNMTHMSMPPNMTHMTMPPNMTHMTMPPNMTHMTMPPNMTTAAGNNATSATMATAAPPLETNTTVVALVENITNSGCGSEQFCGSQPASCNPNVPGECFFVGARRQSGRDFAFDLSGESEGYLAASLSTGSQLGNNDTTYVCANNNGTIQFFGALLNNDQLIPTRLPVNNVKGRVIGNRIQCTFSATLPASRSRAETFALGIVTGPFNSSTGTLGSTNIQFRGAPANIANPNATVTNLNNVNSTTPAGTTMATAAPPLETNTTVVALVENITNSGCGSDQLCGSQPASCDPNVPGSCFFVATRQESGRNFGFSLSGESEGYLAAIVSTDIQLGGNDATYVCANNNGTIHFFGALLDNGQLNITRLPVNNVKGRVIGNRIQCTFSATLPGSRNRAAENFALGIVTGPFNSSDGSLGSPNTQFRSPVVNLANPNQNLTNENNVNTTTPASTTPASTTPASTTSSSPAITFQQSLTQALLIAVGVLSLALL